MSTNDAMRVHTEGSTTHGNKAFSLSLSPQFFVFGGKTLSISYRVQPYRAKYNIKNDNPDKQTTTESCLARVTWKLISDDTINVSRILFKTKRVHTWLCLKAIIVFVF